MILNYIRRNYYSKFVSTTLNDKDGKYDTHVKYQ